MINLHLRIGSHLFRRLPRNLVDVAVPKYHFHQGFIHHSRRKRFFPFIWKSQEGGHRQSAGQVNLQATQNSELDEGPVTGLTYKVKDQLVSGSMPSANVTPNAEESDEVEAVVGNVNDLQLGKVKEVEIGSEKALIVKETDGIFAFGSKCTHYGLPLGKGAYCNGRIRCPFHGACFNVKTGDIEDFPGLDSIHTFKVDVENDIVKVQASKEKLTQFRRVKNMVNCKSEAQQQTFLLIGGGPASLSCAETLRQEGFEGRIIIVTKENCPPYDRPKISKAMNSTADSIALRKKEFFTEHSIELQTGKELINLDVDKSSAQFKDGSTINYNSLMIATGGIPRYLEVPGSDLRNVCYLRTPDDANYIDKESVDKNVVIIGSSFVGMEVASVAIGKASSVNVVCRDDLPFKNVFGTQLAKRIMELHKEKGVNFHYNCEATEFLGSDGNLTTVVLNNGTSLSADICVVGIGMTPATNFLKETPLQMNSKGYITVDKHMQTNKERVYAAGDITEFPLFMKDDSIVNVQHYQMAHSQGHNAALNMLGKKQELKSVPFFWSVMFGKSIRYAGYGVGYDDTVVFEDDQKIATFFIKENTAVAVASLNHDPIVAKFAELLFNGKTLSKLDILNKSNEWLFS